MCATKIVLNQLQNLFIRATSKIDNTFRLRALNMKINCYRCTSLEAFTSFISYLLSTWHFFVRFCLLCIVFILVLFSNLFILLFDGCYSTVNSRSPNHPLYIIIIAVFSFVDLKFEIEWRAM